MLTDLSIKLSLPPGCLNLIAYFSLIGVCAHEWKTLSWTMSVLL